MEISVILAHPSPESLTFALARAAADALTSQGHDVRWHDLASEGFDPRLTNVEIAEHRSRDPLVELHARELRDADGLVLVHPIWFAQPPALMKGWVDRVVREGTAFRKHADGSIEPLLRVGSALLITTANTGYDPAEGDDLDRFWWEVALAPTGASRLDRLAFAPVVSSTPDMRSDWIRQASERAIATFGSSEDGPKADRVRDSEADR